MPRAYEPLNQALPTTKHDDYNAHGVRIRLRPTAATWPIVQSSGDI
jgi:hypothetical protein